MLRALAVTPLAALPLGILLWLSGEVPLPAALAAMAVFSFVVFGAGFLLLRAAEATELGAPAAWVLGVVASASALFALVMAMKILAATAFAAWAAVVVAAQLYFRAAERTSRDELLALLLGGGATLFWCWGVAEVPAVLAREGVMTTWVDQFGHGSMISQFGDPRAGAERSILLSGMPLWAYHYASYTLPAVLAWPLDLPGLPLSTSVWVPLGFFTLCAGAYVLGAALAGPLGGVGAIAVIALMPDPASYGLQNRAFSFYWYQVQVPGGAYGVGASLVAVALLQRWAAGLGARPLVAGFLVIVASAAIRLHIFLLAFPAWLLSAAIMAPWLRGRRLPFLALASALFALFVFAFYALRPDAAPAFAQFIELARNPYHPVYHTWHPRIAGEYGPAAAIGTGLLLLVPAVLGIFVLLYPVSLILLRRARGLQAIDLVPVFLLVVFLLLVLTAPVPPHGDSTEFTQRPFVLLYAVIAIWTIAGFASWLNAMGGLRAARVRVALVLVAALWVACVLVFTVRDFRWARVHEVTDGLPAAARYLRSHSHPGDALAVAGLWMGRSFMDDAVRLVGMTGIPAYLSAPFTQSTLGGRAAEVAERHRALLRVAEETEMAAALARLRALGVRWYVVLHEDSPRWDPGRRNAVFVEGKTAVYATR
jgi:hypothetical protein